MTKDSYSLPSGKARICRVAGAIFLLCAVAMWLGIALTGILAGAPVRCVDTGCVVSVQPGELLDADVVAKVQSSPAAQQTYATYVHRPLVRLGIVGIMLIETGPFAMLLVGVGMALRSLGGGGREALARALKWLRRASQAALAWAVARPISDSLMDSLLSAGTPDGAQWQISIDSANIGTALMLGIAAFATVWALEAGLKAQRDLADFV